jgi:hypothetical protein
MSHSPGVQRAVAAAARRAGRTRSSVRRIAAPPLSMTESPQRGSSSSTARIRLSVEFCPRCRTRRGRPGGFRHRRFLAAIALQPSPASAAVVTNFVHPRAGRAARSQRAAEFRRARRSCSVQARVVLVHVGVVTLLDARHPGRCASARRT